MVGFFKKKKRKENRAVLSSCLLSLHHGVLVKSCSKSCVSCISWFAFPFAFLPTEPQVKNTLDKQFPSSSHFNLPISSLAPPPSTIWVPIWGAVFTFLAIKFLGGRMGFPTASLVINSYLPEWRACILGRWSQRAIAMWWSHILPCLLLEVLPLVLQGLCWKILLMWFQR